MQKLSLSREQLLSDFFVNFAEFNVGQTKFMKKKQGFVKNKNICTNHAAKIYENGKNSSHSQLIFNFQELKKCSLPEKHLLPLNEIYSWREGHNFMTCVICPKADYSLSELGAKLRKSNKSLREIEIFYILKQTSEALSYLLTKGKANHSGLSARNILFLEKEIFLDDYIEAFDKSLRALSKDDTFNEELYRNVVMAPELYEYQKNTSEVEEIVMFNLEKNDVFCLGFVVIETLSDENNLIDAMRKIVKAEEFDSFFKNLCEKHIPQEDLKELIISMLKHNSSERPRLNDIIERLNKLGLSENFDRNKIPLLFPEGKIQKKTRKLNKLFFSELSDSTINLKIFIDEYNKKLKLDLDNMKSRFLAQKFKKLSEKFPISNKLVELVTFSLKQGFGGEILDKSLIDSYLLDKNKLGELILEEEGWRIYLHNCPSNDVAKFFTNFDHQSAFEMVRADIMRTTKEEGCNSSPIVIHPDSSKIGYLWSSKKEKTLDYFLYHQKSHKFSLDQKVFLIRSIIKNVEFYHSKKILLNRLTPRHILLILNEENCIVDTKILLPEEFKFAEADSEDDIINPNFHLDFEYCSPELLITMIRFLQHIKKNQKKKVSFLVKSEATLETEPNQTQIDKISNEERFTYNDINISEKTDIWSLGIIIHEILYSAKPNFPWKVNSIFGEQNCLALELLLNEMINVINENLGHNSKLFLVESRYGYTDNMTTRDLDDIKVIRRLMKKCLEFETHNRVSGKDFAELIEIKEINDIEINIKFEMKE